MPPNADLPTTAVLFIDGNDTDRKYFADQLKGRSPDYTILEAATGEEGLILYRSRRIDCVVIALELPDQPGLRILVDLVPIASRPNVAVVVLTSRLQRGLREIARQNGAYACFVKRFMSGEDLENAIQRAWPLSDRCQRKIGTGLCNCDCQGVTTFTALFSLHPSNPSRNSSSAPARVRDTWMHRSFGTRPGGLCSFSSSISFLYPPISYTPPTPPSPHRQLSPH